MTCKHNITVGVFLSCWRHGRCRRENAQGQNETDRRRTEPFVPHYHITGATCGQIHLVETGCFHLWIAAAAAKHQSASKRIKDAPRTSETAQSAQFPGNTKILISNVGVTKWCFWNLSLYISGPVFNFPALLTSLWALLVCDVCMDCLPTSKILYLDLDVLFRDSVTASEKCDVYFMHFFVPFFFFCKKIHTPADRNKKKTKECIFNARARQKSKRGNVELPILLCIKMFCLFLSVKIKCLLWEYIDV